MGIPWAQLPDHVKDKLRAKGINGDDGDSLIIPLRRGKIPWGSLSEEVLASLHDMGLNPVVLETRKQLRMRDVLFPVMWMMIGFLLATLFLVR